MKKATLRILNKACELAEKWDHDGTYKFCCILAKGPSIIAIGYNRLKSHTLSLETEMQSLHAEMSVLRGRREDLSRHTLYVVRFSPGRGGLANAKPCNVCMRLIESLGVGEVIYSHDVDVAKRHKVRTNRVKTVRI